MIVLAEGKPGDGMKLAAVKIETPRVGPGQRLAIRFLADTCIAALERREASKRDLRAAAYHRATAQRAAEYALEVARGR